MQRRIAGHPDELPVEDLLAFGRLKDERHDPRAINAKHGDKIRLNRDIQEVVRQSRETGPMPAAVPVAVQSEQGKYSTHILISRPVLLFCCCCICAAESLS
jgi:predicted ATPase